MDMRVRKVTASIGLTIKTGQYETARIELGAEADIGDDQGVSTEESERYHVFLCAQLRERVAKQVEHVKALAKDASRSPSNGVHRGPG